MLDRTQSLSRKVEHLPIKLSVQSHQLHLIMVFSINRWCLLRIRPENQFSETNGKKPKSGLISGLAQESQQNTTAQTQRSLPPTVKWSRLHFDLQTQSGFTLRPSPPSSGDMESARASRSSGSSTSCISQPNLMSGMCRISSPNKPLRNLIRRMWSRSRLWNGSAVARLMDARSARVCLEILSGRSVERRG